MRKVLSGPLPLPVPFRFQQEAGSQKRQGEEAGSEGGLRAAGEGAAAQSPESWAWLFTTVTLVWGMCDCAAAAAQGLGVFGRQIFRPVARPRLCLVPIHRLAHGRGRCRCTETARAFALIMHWAQTVTRPSQGPQAACLWGTCPWTGPGLGASLCRG